MLIRRLARISLLLLSATAFLSCKESNHPKKQPEIAVANSYLLSVVKDLYGNKVDVISFVPPGMCPGHFDISPSQVEQLSKCKILLLFDFQGGIGSALSRFEERGLKIYSITAPQGLCLPETYLTIVRNVADVLSKDNPAKRMEFDRRIESIEKRLNVLTKNINAKIEQSGLKNAPVLSSRHQAVFAKWLGLDVIAMFVGSDIETPAGINLSLQQARDKNIKLVVANQQEGTELAEALARHLNARMVVFGNFPTEEGDAPTFNSLLLKNVSGLFKNKK
jgi:ABC-type Zn uptake system ZnuABC Zn-binding protein ZnuA